MVHMMGVYRYKHTVAQNAQVNLYEEQLKPVSQYPRAEVVETRLPSEVPTGTVLSGVLVTDADPPRTLFPGQEARPLSPVRVKLHNVVDQRPLDESSDSDDSSECDGDCGCACDCPKPFNPPITLPNLDDKLVLLQRQSPVLYQQPTPPMVAQPLSDVLLTPPVQQVKELTPAVEMQSFTLSETTESKEPTEDQPLLTQQSFTFSETTEPSNTTNSEHTESKESTEHTDQEVQPLLTQQSFTFSETSTQSDTEQFTPFEKALETLEKKCTPL